MTGKGKMRINRMMIMMLIGLIMNICMIAQACPESNEWHSVFKLELGVQRKFYKNKRQLMKAKQQLKRKHSTGTDASLGTGTGTVHRDPHIDQKGIMISSICQQKTSASVYLDERQENWLTGKGISDHNIAHRHTHKAQIEHRHENHCENFIRTSILKKESEFSSGFQVKMNYVESFYVGCTSFKIPKDQSIPYKVVGGLVYFLCNFLHDSGSNLSIVSRSLIEHADGTVVPEERDRTVIGIHGPKTEKYGSIN